ncbi:MAG: peptide-methionine (S)-S-oxide reductase MsrA [Rhodospirillales bacterium]
MTEQAIFGAGCFWGVEAAFRSMTGVTATEVGYAGGKTSKPTYQQVCYDDTGHAEVVRVTFNPALTTYEKLLAKFWACHDPTQINRQGPDVGDQYRTCIFYLNDEQKVAAEASKATLAASGRHYKPIATEITKAPTFWLAEDYHQQYFEKRGIAGGCH